jgi:hypothetical protein
MQNVTCLVSVRRHQNLETVLRHIDAFFEDSVRTSQRTQCGPISKTSWWILYRGIVAFCCKNNAEHKGTLRGTMQRF